MALPNYSPSGTILLGCVPWDNSYRNVRLYSSVSEQHTDISNRMTISTSDYVYVARNRRLKVSVHADRLYHINYCAFQNASLGSGWIYCFVTDVQYINDQTTELTIETDVFQTYLYGTDWTVPACFIERKTVGSEAEKYMYTAEPDFNLVQKPYDVKQKFFAPGGYIIMTCEEPRENNNIIETVLNPTGYYGKPAPIHRIKGTVQGCGYWYVGTAGSPDDALQLFLNGLTFAGAIDSVVAIFTVPSFYTPTVDEGWITTSASPDAPLSSQEDFLGSPKVSYLGSTTNHYTPRNKKLLYYPYTRLILSDYNGNEGEYRYEWFNYTEGSGVPVFKIKYAPNPACQAIVVPDAYANNAGFLSGQHITVNCGAQGSWSNNMYQTWLAQNAGKLAAAGAAALVMGVAGGASMGAAANEIARANEFTAAARARNIALTTAQKEGVAASIAHGEQTMRMGGQMAAGAAMYAGSQATNLMYQSKQPTVHRGTTDYSLMFQTGVQGVFSSRMQVIPEQAELIDKFFDRFGYSVGAVEAVELNTRPYWNYVKTVGAAAVSYNTVPSATVPHSRGRGCPSDALAVINSALDGGCTFWHTTSSFGDYSQNNSL